MDDNNDSAVVCKMGVEVKMGGEVAASPFSSCGFDPIVDGGCSGKEEEEEEEEAGAAKTVEDNANFDDDNDDNDDGCDNADKLTWQGAVFDTMVEESGGRSR